MRIAIGADHRGFALKQFLLAHHAIGMHVIEWTDQGTYSADRTDYPLFARPVAELVQSQSVDAGILLCGTGVGVAIVANRYSGVFAGVAWNETLARLNKEDDNVNVLCLPADYITHEDAYSVINVWLTASFKDGRYAERLAMI